MINTPQIAHSESRQVAFIPMCIPREQIREVMGPGISEVFAAITAQGLAPTGPWFSHHLRMDPAVFDFEICVPVNAPVTPVGRVQAGTLRAARVARTVYGGPYEGLGAAWGEFMAWIDAQGLRGEEDLWECYSVGPESSSNPADWRTELNRPLKND